MFARAGSEGTCHGYVSWVGGHLGGVDGHGRDDGHRHVNAGFDDYGADARVGVEQIHRRVALSDPTATGVVSRPSLDRDGRTKAPRGHSTKSIMTRRK